MPFGDVHFSSETDLWATPQAFFDVLAREFSFNLDVCAVASNAKCRMFISPEQDGLSQTWGLPGSTAWCNPPYGKMVGRWVEKAWKESKRGVTVAVLIFARTDTDWWHKYAMQAAEIRFVQGRLKFGDSVNAAPSPSVVLVFRPGHCGPAQAIAMQRDGKMNTPPLALEF